MEVEPDERRIGVGLGHQNRRRAESAADVGDRPARPQPGVDTGESRNPALDEVGSIARPEEPLGAMEEIVFVLVPPHAGAGAKRFGERVDRAPRRRHGLEATDDEGGAVLVDHRLGLFGRQREPAVAVVGGVAGRGLGAEPFTDVAPGGVGAARQLIGVNGGGIGGSGRGQGSAPVVVEFDHECPGALQSICTSVGPVASPSHSQSLRRKNPIVQGGYGNNIQKSANHDTNQAVL